ncbi:hypothetical protein FQN55_005278 [Onygenales sp. PD_40]|nr:hypothetical protein FQN55_005278 [Onygenales sp. PD_40]
MSFVIADSVPWHQGEEAMHKLMHVPYSENPSAPYLTPGAAYLAQKSPLIALGTVDNQGRPWTTLWGGNPGFAAPVAQSVIGVRTFVDKKYDPVVEALFGGKDNGEVVKEEGDGRLMAGLPVDMENRRRVKLMGRMMGGALAGLKSMDPAEQGKEPEHAGEAQLVMKIEESLGNCPKYISRKHITPAVPKPNLISDSPELPPGAVELLSQADTLFISSIHENSMDTNIRGGPPGFVRLVSNGPDGAVIAYPEYSGNRLYQTLGNLKTTPLAGYVFPNFETGNVLYVTGRADILVGKDAAALLPRSNLALRVTVTGARYVENGLPFRGHAGDPSPYNPQVRYLTTEKPAPSAQGSDRTSTTATLIKKEILTPSIGRFRFKISDPSAPGKWTPGQYATLSFQNELDMGYSHMKDDDPTSINDDYIRTFTISSYPSGNLTESEFEITVRKKGNVTRHLFMSSERSGLDIELRGYGGEFRFEDKPAGKTTTLTFIAGGIGITPLIAQLPGIDISRLQLFWSVAVQDLGLVLDTYRQFPELPTSTTLFVTGTDRDLSEEERANLASVSGSGTRVHRRRLGQRDLDVPQAEEWYLCAGTGLKAVVLNWLAGKKVVYEDFNY